MKDSDEATELGSIDPPRAFLNHDPSRAAKLIGVCAFCKTRISKCTCPNGPRAVLCSLSPRDQRATEEKEAAGQAATETGSIASGPKATLTTFTKELEATAPTMPECPKCGSVELVDKLVIAGEGSHFCSNRNCETPFMPAAAQGKSEVPAFRVGVTGWTERDGRPIVQLTSILCRDESQPLCIPGPPHGEGSHASERAAIEVVAKLNELDEQRSAAVRRANAIAAERDHQVGHVTRLTKRVRDLEAEAEVLAGQVTVAKLEVQDLKAERDELARRDVLLTRDLRASELRGKGLKCMLEEWGQAADAAGFPPHEDPAQRLRGEARKTEVESIAPSNFDRLVIGDPVLTPAGVKGEVVGFSRWIDVEVQGRRGMPSTLSFPENDVTPVTEMESASGSEHCGEQGTMDAGSIASEGGGA